MLSILVLIIFLSFIVGQLLKERTSKERILYVTTTFMSIVSLIAIMLLQTFDKLPKASAIINPVKQQMHQLITESAVSGDSKMILEEGFRQFAVQLPSYIVIAVFLLILINLIITFPILRKFKVATPIFKTIICMADETLDISHLYYCAVLCYVCYPIGYFSKCRIKL
ncbi:Predicted membrane protein [Staphylococcus gallinarum]|uniref:Predicted membrane protein n=1 Tax=Staphylococcus gallinarum TaxID=1293 RepID=A0A380FBU7_STAGA|nr:Predicted membrane protein [Staphylococcus gallinarum]